MSVTDYSESLQKLLEEFPCAPCLENHVKVLTIVTDIRLQNDRAERRNELSVGKGSISQNTGLVLVSPPIYPLKIRRTEKVSQ